MVESVIHIYDRNIQADDALRIRFVNYRSLGGIGNPVWGAASAFRVRIDFVAARGVRVHELQNG